jgi:hypothetical protein
MAARTPKPEVPGPSMQERIRLRLRERVHQVFALEAAHASKIGDPTGAYAVGCRLPDDPEPEEPETLPRHYPVCMGIVGVLRRRCWLAEHRQRLHHLVVQA